MNRSSFVKLYDKVMGSSLGHDMASIKEDSHWHREESVKEHTRMVLAWYYDVLSNKRNERQEYLTMIALLFHDVGKPKARTEKFSEQRGVYYSYPGHEKISANMFMDFVMENRDFAPISVLTWSDIRTIRFLIEYHLPYETTKTDKLIHYKKDLLWQGEDALQMYYDVLRSDAHGRISDDAQGTYDRVESWIEKFDSVEVDEMSTVDDSKPTLKILIGASGSGKSTYSQKFSNDYGYKIFSLDECRLDFFAQENGREGAYDEAFTYACGNECGFNNFSATRYTKLIQERASIVLDNVNATMKSRRRWIVQARQAGYNVVAVEFPIALSTVLQRQHTRGDKKVPSSVVERQYYSLSVPLIGSEVDVIEIV